MSAISARTKKPDFLFSTSVVLALFLVKLELNVI